MTEHFKPRSVSVALPDLARLYQYKNKSEVIRKALDIFIKREKTIKKDTKQKEITETNTSFGIEPEKLEYLESLCVSTETDSRCYFSVSEIVRTALRDLWIIEDVFKSKELIEELEIIEEYSKDYLERNGIKILRVLS